MGRTAPRARGADGSFVEEHRANRVDPRAKSLDGGRRPGGEPNPHESEKLRWRRGLSPLLQPVAAMIEWPPFVIEGPTEKPDPGSGWEEVVFELEDAEAGGAGGAAVPAAVGAASRGAG